MQTTRTTSTLYARIEELQTVLGWLRERLELVRELKAGDAAEDAAEPLVGLIYLVEGRAEDLAMLPGQPAPRGAGAVRKTTTEMIVAQGRLTRTEGTTR